MEKPLRIEKVREPYIYYLVHYKDRIDFVTLEGKLIGSSEIIEVVE